VNWPADQLLAASAIAAAQGVPQPCAAQLPYNVGYRDEVESPEMQAALAACRAPVVASYVLFGGVLTGKYDDDPAAGRAAGTLDDPRVAQGIVVARRLVALARSVGVSPARLAFAFALAPPSVASVLFGATRPEQVWENVSALAVVDSSTSRRGGSCAGSAPSSSDAARPPSAGPAVSAGGCARWRASTAGSRCRA
jgi:aryl-alcohol dehydrogenase-like predicted oxidoreductase